MDIFSALSFRKIDEVSAALEAEVSINARVPGTYRTPLTLAIALGYEEAVAVLLSKNADANLRDGNNTLPLYLAVSMNQLKATENLIAYGVNRADVEMTLLLAPSSEMIDLLMKNGARIDARDNLGNTVIHTAAFRSNCHLLLPKLKEYGADLNAGDNDGITPLVDTITDGGVEGCVALIENGALLSFPEQGKGLLMEALKKSLIKADRSDLIV